MGGQIQAANQLGDSHLGPPLATAAMEAALGQARISSRGASCPHFCPLLDEVLHHPAEPQGWGVGQEGKDLPQTPRTPRCVRDCVREDPPLWSGSGSPAGGRVRGHGLARGCMGQMLKLNSLFWGVQKVWGPSEHLTVEGPGQMAHKVGVQSGGPRWAHRSEVVLMAKATRKPSPKSPNPPFCRW